MKDPTVPPLPKQTSEAHVSAAIQQHIQALVHQQLSTGGEVFKVHPQLKNLTKSSAVLTQVNYQAFMLELAAMGNSQSQEEEGFLRELGISPRNLNDTMDSKRDIKQTERSQRFVGDLKASYPKSMVNSSLENSALMQSSLPTNISASFLKKKALEVQQNEYHKMKTLEKPKRPPPPPQPVSISTYDHLIITNGANNARNSSLVQSTNGSQVILQSENETDLRLPQIYNTQQHPAQPVNTENAKTTEPPTNKFKNPPVTTVKLRKKNQNRNNIYCSSATIDVTQASGKKVFVIPALKQIYDMNSQSPLPDTTPFQTRMLSKDISSTKIQLNIQDPTHQVVQTLTLGGPKQSFVIEGQVIKQSESVAGTGIPSSELLLDQIKINKERQKRVLIAKGSNLGSSQSKDMQQSRQQQKSNLSVGKGSEVQAAPPGLMMQRQQRWEGFIGQEPWGRGKKKNALKMLNEDLLLMNEMMKMPDNLSGKNLPLASAKPPPKPQYQLPERLIQQYQTFKEEHTDGNGGFLPSIPNCRCCPSKPFVPGTYQPPQHHQYHHNLNQTQSTAEFQDIQDILRHPSPKLHHAREHHSLGNSSPKQHHSPTTHHNRESNKHHKQAVEKSMRSTTQTLRSTHYSQKPDKAVMKPSSPIHQETQQSQLNKQLTNKQRSTMREGQSLLPAPPIQPPFDEWHRSQASREEAVEMRDTIMEVVNFGNLFPDDVGNSKIVVKVQS
ncbi:hypothetical protein FGO68_gene13191 [Halteria grandinella]|uniref:Uncharacterized protein n=1 Tax=Halteria grandinella TaxID=5974 RepID=A0A8J8SWU9_HALGN|nr:hypothetical protein FGO68_gene13191 [Halteria grandinella]